MRGPYVPVWLNPETGVRERLGPDMDNVFETIRYTIEDCWETCCRCGLWDYPVYGIWEHGVVSLDTRELVWQGPEDFFYSPNNFPPTAAQE